MAATVVAEEDAAVAGISFTFRSQPGRIIAGDSGESAIPFFLLTLPWGMMLPKSLIYAAAWAYLAFPLGWLLVILNGLILYVPFGFRLKPKET